jgi:hypothetical protein
MTAEELVELRRAEAREVNEWFFRGAGQRTKLYPR